MHPYEQGVRAAKIAFQLTDDDKDLGDKILPFLGAVDPTKGLATGAASAMLSPEGAGERAKHGLGGALGTFGGQIAGGLGGGILGAILGLPIGALLGRRMPGHDILKELPTGLSESGRGAVSGLMHGVGIGGTGGGLIGGYKGTQLGRHLAGGKKKPEHKDEE